MAFGITKAVIFFSIVLISVKGRTIWMFSDAVTVEQDSIVSWAQTHVRDPSKDVCVEADMVFRDIQTSLYQDVL